MAYLDGAPAEPADLQALALTNFGHFTSMRVDEGRIRGLELHLDRLVRDCRSVFDAELDRTRVLGFVRQAVGDQDGAFVVRVTVFDPRLEMGRPGADADPRVLVTHRPTSPAPLPPMRVASVPYQRDRAEVKHTGLFGQLSARRVAQRAGYDDALFVGPSDGCISEGGTWNVGIIDADGRVVWPKGAVLPGVTMQLLQAAHESVTEPVVLADIPRTARAAFATNTSIGVRPIAAIDGTELDVEDPVLDALHRRYADIPCDSP